MSRHNIVPASVRSGKITLDIDWMGLPVGHGELFQTESLPAAGETITHLTFDIWSSSQSLNQHKGTNPY